MKIVEVIGGTTNSTKQFIWCDSERCEAHDGSSAVTAQYFSRGEVISGSSFYFNLDHLGSIREMTNSAGTIVWQQSFDPYGVPTTLVSTTPADFGFAGYYTHQRSGLNLALFRSYNASLGRWLSRDPVEHNLMSQTTGVRMPPSGMAIRGTTARLRIASADNWNVYMYAANNPVKLVDPMGLAPCYPGIPQAGDDPGGPDDDVLIAITFCTMLCLHADNFMLCFWQCMSGDNPSPNMNPPEHPPCHCPQ